MNDEFEIHEGQQIEEDLIPMLASTTEVVSYRDFEHAEKCIAAIPSIKSWGILNIRIFHKFTVSLPKQMANCESINLQCLQFQQIKLSGIEGLSRVYMPALERFCLGSSILNLV